MLIALALLASVPPWFWAVVAGAGVPLIPYILHARRTSGKIVTSEATDLWLESKAIREDYRIRIGLLEKRIAILEERSEALHKLNDRLTGENLDLKRRSSP